MNCFPASKKIDSFYQYEYYDDQRQFHNQPSQNAYQPYTVQNYDNLNLNPNELHLDVESFVATLPSLEELDSFDPANNHYVYSSHDLVTLADQNQYQYNNQTGDLSTSKVEILNQVLHTASNSGINNYSNSSSSYSSFSSTSNSSIEQYTLDTNQSPKKRSLKCKIKRKDEKICCNVCGYKSSGFHYGSHTCEACKLFFRRTEKQIRKTGFNQCKTKNCQINYENRANCSECRYKKCIAVGMGMSRSRFGRHTGQLGSNYAPNVSESLCSLVANLKQICLKSKIDLLILNDLIVDFYRKTKKLLTASNSVEEQITNLEFSLQVDSPLSELSYLINQTKPMSTQCAKLPNCLVVLFCVLFDIQINSADEKQQRMVNDFGNFLQKIDEKILKTNQLVLILKIGLYFKIINHLLTNLSMTKDDPYDKRITDLMRSEFALFKFESNEHSEYNLCANGLSPSASSSSSSSTQSTSDIPVLAKLFLELNQLLYKNMTPDEFDTFVVNQLSLSENLFF
ncbi:peroxisome proliferator-activated receptor alpha [Brachionus plicatilis]|uniref:Peroxisome proliferator-activated receptor alpha n=1 Tax=Brachionus plicatilis TaxID=10195 RepID=A0A3M7R5J2_BRAPC|nr:peroxisome proliferator-activated receptor alpha [Brachionus plicatilis]